MMSKRSLGDHEDTLTLKKTSKSWVNAPKFLVVKIKNNDNSFQKVSPFYIRKCVEGITAIKSLKKLRNGTILIETDTDKQSLLLLKVTKLGDLQVEVEPHSSLNSSKGVVRCFDLMNCSIDEIKSELAPQLVTDVIQIHSKRSGSLKPTPVFIFSFATPIPPKSIIAGYNHLDVRPYVSRPLRCYKCQRFGHSQNSCNNKSLCADCAQESHGTLPCQSEKKCVNCKGNHSSSSIDCPKWKEEEAIQKLRASENISIFEARKKYYTMLPPAFKRSFAETVKKQTTTSQTQSQSSSEIPPVSSQPTNSDTSLMSELLDTIKQLKGTIEQLKNQVDAQAKLIEEQNKQIQNLSKKTGAQTPKGKQVPIEKVIDLAQQSKRKQRPHKLKRSTIALGSGAAQTPRNKKSAATAIKQGLAEFHSESSSMEDMSEENTDSPAVVNPAAQFLKQSKNK
jgi:hypothetical protein